MKDLFTIHIVNLEGRNCYYATGISIFSIPFHLANTIELLKLNLKTKESFNFYPQFCAFQKTYKQLYKFRHSIRNLFQREITGSFPQFHFLKLFQKNLKSIHPQ